MVVALAGVAVLALLVLVLGDATRAPLDLTAAEAARARMIAAADGAIALVIEQIAREARNGADPFARPERHLTFAGASITVRLEDERGKIPLNHLDDASASRLAEALGAEGTDILRDSLEDWIDDDHSPRPSGAEQGWYDLQAGPRLRVRDGAMTSIEELAMVRGVSRAVLARLLAVVTVETGDAPFAPRHASALARQVMAGSDAEAAFAAIEQERDDEDDAPALDLPLAPPASPLVVTLLAVAQNAASDRASRRVVATIPATGLPRGVVHWGQ